jgi:hypothetical protein
MSQLLPTSNFSAAVTERCAIFPRADKAVSDPCFTSALWLVFILSMFYHLFIYLFIFAQDMLQRGHMVAWLVEALCYKPEGRGFEFR